MGLAESNGSIPPGYYDNNGTLSFDSLLATFDTDTGYLDLCWRIVFRDANETLSSIMPTCMKGGGMFATCTVTVGTVSMSTGNGNHG